MLQLFLKPFRYSLTPSRKFKFLTMIEQVFPFLSGLTSIPVCPGCHSSWTPWCPRHQPSSFIPACFWMRLSFSSKFLFLFARREDSYRFSGASLRRSACLSGHHPFPEGDWELSHLCSQILKSQITQFTIGLPHQSPWRQAPGPRHLGQYLAPGRIRGVQLPQWTLS